MNILDLIKDKKKTAFSFEILPPLKGSDIDKTFSNIETLLEFEPKYINITAHRDEVYDNSSKKRVVMKRPGTTTIAAAIKYKYNIVAVPHLICGGFTKSETEYALIDLNFLGIHNLLVLRGDCQKSKDKYRDGENSYAIDLAKQINDFNSGLFLEGTKFEPFKKKFSYGVAGYPEKHFEAVSFEEDLKHLKEKVDAGADYIVTQMFFDNEKYFNFVKECRKIGITKPIIPGIKPLNFLSQKEVIPKIFSVEFPEELKKEFEKCKSDKDTIELGIEWCTMQAKELKEKGALSIHFYAFLATNSVKEIAKRVY